MGNWTTVNLRGTLAAEHLDAATEFVTPNADYSNFHCLSHGTGLFGLGRWVAEEIHGDGNLAERDYDAEDVAETLRALVEVAPSLRLKVHVGGDYESLDCVATVTAQDGTVTVGPPERATLTALSEDVARGRLFGILGAS